MILIERVTKRFGYRDLFTELSWQIPDQGIFGFVGENGAGKSTLLRMIAGEEEYDGGEIVIPKGTTIGYLPQEIHLLESGPLLKVVEGGRGDLVEQERELAELEAALKGESSEEAVRRYSEAQERFQRGGGYVWRSQAREILAGVGFQAEQFSTAIEDFSGGWQMRAMLARLLLMAPTVLLMDEPTNHLDLQTVEWLETYLGRYDGTVIVVSHDRAFLNRMVTGIVELERGTIQRYSGNYDSYREERSLRRERLAQAAEQQQAEIAKIELFIERFRFKARKAGQVQSRVKRLEKLDRIEGPDSELKSIQFSFPQPPRLGRIVVDVSHLAKSFGSNTVYSDLNLVIERGEKVALVGPNGAGKTTLLRILAGVDTPDGGEVTLGNNVEVAYFSQHAVDQLDAKKTVLNELWDVDVTKSQTEIRNMLGAFRFSGDDVQKQVSVLSGGEKSRLALAKLILKPGGLLLLDEPTNHLDIASRQTLEFALNMFEGAFVVVSHDRYFIDEVVNRVVHVEGGKVTSYVGNYTEYVEQKGRGGEEVEERGKESSSGQMNRRELRQQLTRLRQERDREARDLKKRIADLEQRIEKGETELEEIEGRFVDPGIYDTPGKVQELTIRQSELNGHLTEWLAEWEVLATEMQGIEEEYQRRAAEIGEG